MKQEKRDAHLFIRRQLASLSPHDRAEILHRLLRDALLECASQTETLGSTAAERCCYIEGALEGAWRVLMLSMNPHYREHPL